MRAHFSLFARKGAQGDVLIYRYLHHRFLTLRQMDPLITSYLASVPTPPASVYFFLSSEVLYDLQDKLLWERTNKIYQK